MTVIETNVVDAKRYDLALAHRLFSEFGWDDLTYTHLTVRHPSENSYFIMPFGQLFSEVTPDNLLEVDFSGQVVAGTAASYNPTAHVIHGSIYQARKDVNVVFHSHTPENVAVSTLKQGLLPLSQWALLFYERFGFHEYDSLSLHAQRQGSQLVQDLDQHSILLMRHHGVVVAATDVAEAFYLHYHLQMACVTQCKLLAMNQDFDVPDHKLCQGAAKDLNAFEQHNGHRDWQALKRNYQYLLSTQK